MADAAVKRMSVEEFFLYEAQDPRMVVEVLSPSNQGLSWQRKFEEYRQHGKLVHLP